MNLLKENRLQWCIGGAQGSGVDTSANIFSRACAEGGLWVMGKREYFSNIKGEHSYFVVRVGEKQARALYDAIDVLATFDEETVARHFDEVVKGGALIYDSALANRKVEEIPTLDQRIKDELARRFSSSSPTLSTLVESCRSRGVHVYAINYAALLSVISSKTGEKRSSILGRMVNVIAVAVSFALLKYDIADLKSSIDRIFGGKKNVAAMNITAAEVAYEYVAGNFHDEVPYRLSKIPKGAGKRMLLNGNQAVALGKVAAGLRFQTYYPITPAADESTYLEHYERFPMHGQDGKRGSIVVLQAEDEIAAVTMAIGGVLAGARTSTCTSGPGFSLMAEGIGWAGINEVPLVVTNYQRAGPSTGMPTRHEQGDLKFSMYGGHGDFPRIVLCSGDLEECFYDANHAFNYAERYQMPVIHLLDKAIANSTESVPYFDPSKMHIDRGLFLGDGVPFVLNKDEEYARFKFTENGISPRVPAGTPGAIFWNTGDEHTEIGHITEDPVLRNRMMEKRMGKLNLALKEIPADEQFHYFGDEKPDLLVVSWGSTKGSLLEAIEELRKEGKKIGFLQMRLILPFPAEKVKEFAARAGKVAVMEMNYVGQLADVMAEYTGILAEFRIVKYNGRPVTIDEARSALASILEGKSEKRVVLTHGA
ncbi:MAG: 2-oxoacid:ferredoxin oxidoreductase subunit alpha [Methanomassiliicoccales archaeon]|nr:2-oxoacid:ferredoxin oxidoreductase subunit alpha [Methanomassiliicoccales archaeon]